MSPTAQIAAEFRDCAVGDAFLPGISAFDVVNCTIGEKRLNLCSRQRYGGALDRRRGLRRQKQNEVPGEPPGTSSAKAIAQG
jgi:hypothetical protein